MPTWTDKYLGQSKPSATTNTSIYSPGSSTETILSSLIICNTNTADTTIRVFHDNDGTTYDATTALLYDEPIRGFRSILLRLHGVMDNASGNLAVYSTSGHVNFTLYGAEVT